MHNANKINTPYNKLNQSLFGGTALAIAYESDPYKVKPEDMTVISVNATSPWYRLVDYQIPEGLPPCPKGGCICTWNWIHTRMNGEGYGSEIVSPATLLGSMRRVAKWPRWPSNLLHRLAGWFSARTGHTPEQSHRHRQSLPPPRHFPPCLMHDAPPRASATLY